MALLNNENAMKSAATTAFSVDYSCRFDGFGTYLERDNGDTATTWTMAWWFKRGKITNEHEYMVIWNGSGSNLAIALLGTDDRLYAHDGTRPYYIEDGRSLRDPSAWMHFCLKVSGGTETAYLNGEVIAFADNSGYSFAPSSTGDIRIGANFSNAYSYSGYISDFHYVSGSAVSPDGNFIEKNDDGLWVPKEYTSSHGDEGFHLDFASAGTTSGSNTGLGKDVSGNSNYFTTSSLDSEDQVIDTPSAGKNFCTLNPLNSDVNALSEGSLKAAASTSTNVHEIVIGTMALETGKYYFEALRTGGGSEFHMGVLGTHLTADEISNDIYNSTDTTYQWRNASGGWNGRGNDASGNRAKMFSTADSGSTDDIAQCAVDTTGATTKVWFGRNDSWRLYDSSSSSFSTGSFDADSPTWSNLNPSDIIPFSGGYGYNASEGVVNFGQDATFAGNKSPSTTYADSGGTGEFFYEPPSGFKALCTENLPDPGVNNATAPAFAAKAYSDGAGAKTFGGAADMKPDLVWVKSRGSTYDHKLTDSVRGTTKSLESNTSDAEDTESTGLTAFGTDGFTVGSDSDYADTTGDGMIAWAWKAHQSGTNEKYNAAAGFSIVTYTGSSDTKTVNHSLGEAPELMFVKALDDDPQGEGSYTNWAVYHKDIGAGGYLMLDSMNASTSDTTIWDNTAPTNTVFTVGYNYGGLDLSYGGDGYSSFGTDYIAYLFRSIEGYSKAGTFTNTADAFVYCGFRPRLLLFKENTAATSWFMWDAARDTYNPALNYLRANTAGVAADSTGNGHDFLSNGFKVREGTGSGADGDTVYFYAVAENPFKHANAR